MTFRAFSWSVFVHDDLLVADSTSLRVALHAGNIGMATGEWEMRFCVVVEDRGRPANGIVTIGAASLIVLGEKLSVVSVFMTGFALRRRICERGLRVRRRLVAIGARNGAMRSEKRIFCFGVIEAGNIAPGFYVVAGFAAEGRSVTSLARHLHDELSFVRIDVARGAGAVLEMERQDFVGTAD